MSHPNFHLAQVNIARLLAPLESPQLAGFVARLEEINTLAEQSPGFVWRMTDESGSDNTYLRPFDDMTLVNLSVWEDVDSLFGYVYQSTHKELFAQRKGWFERLDQPHMALWWVPAGHQPSVDEARARLSHRQQHGDTPHAFSFKQRFEAPA